MHMLYRSTNLILRRVINNILSLFNTDKLLADDPLLLAYKSRTYPRQMNIPFPYVAMNDTDKKDPTYISVDMTQLT